MIFRNLNFLLGTDPYAYWNLTEGFNPDTLSYNLNDLYTKIKELEANTADLESLDQVPELIKSIEQKVEKINKSLTEIIESGSLDS